MCIEEEGLLRDELYADHSPTLWPYALRIYVLTVIKKCGAIVFIFGEECHR
ncbi:hypothetical protein CCP2SC5_50054 [Azospirillaceae bacterium]